MQAPTAVRDRGSDDRLSWVRIQRPERSERDAAEVQEARQKARDDFIRTVNSLRPKFVLLKINSAALEAGMRGALSTQSGQFTAAQIVAASMLYNGVYRRADCSVLGCDDEADDEAASWWVSVVDADMCLVSDGHGRWSTQRVQDLYPAREQVLLPGHFVPRPQVGTLTFSSECSNGPALADAEWKVVVDIRSPTVTLIDLPHDAVKCTYVEKPERPHDQGLSSSCTDRQARREFRGMLIPDSDLDDESMLSTLREERRHHHEESERRLETRLRDLLAAQRRAYVEADAARAEQSRLAASLSRSEEARAAAISRAEEARVAVDAARVSCGLSALKPLPRYSRYSRMHRQQLPVTSEMYQVLSAQFLSSVVGHRHNQRMHEPPLLEVIGIDVIHNPRLLDKYVIAWESVAGITNRHVRELNGVGAIPVQSFDDHKLNEFLLYHGVRHDVADRIATQGADVRYAGENAGKMFGSAIYLASNSSKSDIYTTPDELGVRSIFVLRACLGEAHDTRVAMQRATRPPERPDGRGPLDSVRALTREQGGCVDHPEYMVYESGQVLPQYLVRYRHRTGCKCSHCGP